MVIGPVLLLLLFDLLLFLAAATTMWAASGNWRFPFPGIEFP
jgi:hypothetical protein